MTRALALALLAGCGPSVPCAGDEALCARRFDEVVFPATHNAHSTVDEGFSLPNQIHPIAGQLEDGVRGLMLDTYEYEGESVLCHALCEFGRRPLVAALEDIGGFLRAHPGEIVTIIFESYLSGEATRAAFEAAGLLDALVDHAAGEPWPTLGALVEADTRLVVFTDAAGGAFPGYLDQWAQAFQNPYAAKSADDFRCEAERGSPDNPIYVFNHFLTDGAGSLELAERVNHDPLLLDRLRRCRLETGHLPNFVTVDFYEVGDLFEAVRALQAD